MKNSWGSTKFWGSVFFALMGMEAAKAGWLDNNLGMYLMLIYLIMVGGNVGFRIAERYFLGKGTNSEATK